MLPSVQIDNPEGVDITFIEDCDIRSRLHELLRVGRKARYAHRETFIRGVICLLPAFHDFHGICQHRNLVPGFQRPREIAGVLTVRIPYARQIGVAIFGARHSLRHAGNARDATDA